MNDSNFSDEQQNAIIWKFLETNTQQYGLDDSTISEILEVDISILLSWRSSRQVNIKESARLIRLKHLFRIFRSLAKIFTNLNDGKIWLESQHPTFACSPIDKIRSNQNGLEEVMLYLEDAVSRGA